MNDKRSPSRRDFLRAGAAGAAVLLGNTLPARGEGDRLPRRVLGKTGVQVPILGLGTVALGNLGDEKKAVALLNKAIDLGVTYIDTAPPRTRLALLTGYGRAQQLLNGELKERRKEVFLVTKCLETDGDKTIDLLDKSLKELGVEQVDLTYTHSIGHAVYDYDALVKVSVTGHNRPEKFARVIARRDIDVMMNAVNIVDRHTYAFEDLVWTEARKKKIGLAAMKVFGGGIVTCKMPAELMQASFRFAQSVKGVTLTVIGMRSEKELEQNVEWAKTFKPMTIEEADELKKKTIALAKEWGAHLDKLDIKGEKERPLINT